MFCSACMNLVRRLSLSAARAASSGSIELEQSVLGLTRHRSISNYRRAKRYIGNWLH
jgi:hypothetical protein